jgi:hypothetical protein
MAPEKQGAGNWQQAWTAALDVLEADVTEVESMLTAEHRQRDTPITNAWRPPVGLGPLPLDLRPRADAILNRQIVAATAVTRAIAMNRKQATVAARIEAGQQGAPRPAYVDCAMYRSQRRPRPCRPARQLTDEPPLPPGNRSGVHSAPLRQPDSGGPILN